MLNTRRSVTALLALVFAVNYVETSAEGWFRKSSYLSNDRRYQNAEAAHWLEGYTTFEYQEATGPIAVYGYSAAYFFLFPLLGLGLLLALARRKDMSGYRTLAIAAALDYSISVPFYVFFPVPERWAYPEAMATLLSDQWDARLIAAIRPMSGLDNCFPSFHVSLTVIMIAVCYVYRIRLRTVVSALGCAVILSTYVLGIHWVADIAAGLAAGLLSFAVAMRIHKSLPRNGSAR